MSDAAEKHQRASARRRGPSAWWGGLSTTAKSLYGTLIAVGAAASAVAAIGALVPADTPAPPPPDIRFESVDLAPAFVPLTDFEPRDTLQPAAHVGRTVSSSAMSDVAWEGPDASPSRAVPTIWMPSLGPSVAPTSPGQLVTTVPAPGSGTGNPTGNPTGSPTGPGATGTRTGPKLPKTYLDEVVDQVAADGYKVDEDAVHHIVLPIIANPQDPEGNPVPANEAAAAIVQHLRTVRSRPAGQGLQEPLGLEMDVTMRLRHALDVSVNVAWELKGAANGSHRLSREWLNGVPAYVLTAQSVDDRGVFTLWVPLPKERGRYKLTLVATSEGSGLPVDTISSKVFH